MPLWPQTSRVLQRWFQLLKAKDDTIAFPSLRGTRLSADGLSYMLQQVVTKAAVACPDLKNKRVTPHVIRHYVPSRTMSGLGGVEKNGPEIQGPLVRGRKIRSYIVLASIDC
jgi:integrase